jgi:hypothetical protein
MTIAGIQLTAKAARHSVAILLKWMLCTIAFSMFMKLAASRLMVKLI